MMIVNHGEEDHHECEDALDQRHGVGDHGDGDGDGVGDHGPLGDPGRCHRIHSVLDLDDQEPGLESDHC